jgi:hypothetical protein
MIWGAALTSHTEASLVESNAIEASGATPIEDPSTLEERVATLTLQADTAVLKALQDACVRQRIPLALSLALQLRSEKAIQVCVIVFYC